MRRPTLLWLKRFFGLISFTLILWLSFIVAGIFGYQLPWDPADMVIGTRAPLWNQQIAIISGHAGFDSGAVCLDAQGEVSITEAAINQGVAEKTIDLLTDLGATPLLLEEYDPRLENLQADLLISLHADSCITASGFKAANYTNSRIPLSEARLLACINQHYAAGTDLPEHPNTVTHDMTAYHAFRRIHHQTPAAILEMGFMGGDQTLLTTEQDRIAQAIAQAARCFLAPEPTPAAPTPAAPTPEEPDSAADEENADSD